MITVMITVIQMVIEGNLNTVVLLLSYCFTFYTEESEEEETQPQKTAHCYMASCFYPLFTYSDEKPESWVFVVAISRNHHVFPNVSALCSLKMQYTPCRAEGFNLRLFNG